MNLSAGGLSAHRERNRRQRGAVGANHADLPLAGPGRVYFFGAPSAVGGGCHRQIHRGDLFAVVNPDMFDGDFTGGPGDLGPKIDLADIGGERGRLTDRQAILYGGSDLGLNG